MPEIHSERHRAARKEGEAAHNAGIEREANPYKHQSDGADAEEFDRWTGWNDGWWDEYWFEWERRNRR